MRRSCLTVNNIIADLVAHRLHPQALAREESFVRSRSDRREAAFVGIALSLLLMAELYQGADEGDLTAQRLGIRGVIERQKDELGHKSPFGKFVLHGA